MRKARLVIIFLFFMVFSAGKFSAAENPGFVLKEYYLGSKDAPVVMEEFASLTCTHCADFTINTFPELDKKYIQTGKLRYIYRHFPLDGVSLKAAALAQCMPDDRYYPFLEVLSKNQKQWAFSGNYEQALLQYAKLGGLAEEKAKECIKDSKAFDALVEARTEAQNKHDIDATPTFIFNNGRERITGAVDLEKFSAVIDKLLAEKKR